MASERKTLRLEEWRDLYDAVAQLAASRPVTWVDLNSIEAALDSGTLGEVVRALLSHAPGRPPDAQPDLPPCQLCGGSGKLVAIPHGEYAAAERPCPDCRPPDARALRDRVDDAYRKAAGQAEWLRRLINGTDAATHLTSGLLVMEANAVYDAIDALANVAREAVGGERKP